MHFIRSVYLLCIYTIDICSYLLLPPLKSSLILLYKSQRRYDLLALMYIMYAFAEGGEIILYIYTYIYNVYTLMYSTTSVNSEDIETAVIISIYIHTHTYIYLLYRKTHPDRGIVFLAGGTRLEI